MAIQKVGLFELIPKSYSLKSICFEAIKIL